MSDNTLLVGSYVTNEKAPDWGVGKIVELRDGGNWRVLFEYSGVKIMPSASLASFSPPHNHPLLKNVTPATDLSGAKSFAVMENDFAVQFKNGGFEDPEYLKEERTYKVEASDTLRALCSKEELDALIQAGDYAEVCARATRPVTKTNLLFAIEVIKLADGLKRVPEAQKLFATRFYSLLHGAGEISERFNAYTEALDKLDACKWPVATYPLFLFKPEEYPFVKPRYITEAAKAYSYDIKYEVHPSWKSYSSIIAFVHYVAGALERRGKLKPRDFIDVQGFIWSSLHASLAPKKKVA